MIHKCKKQFDKHITICGWKSEHGDFVVNKGRPNAYTVYDIICCPLLRGELAGVGERARRGK